MFVRNSCIQFQTRNVFRATHEIFICAKFLYSREVEGRESPRKRRGLDLHAITSMEIRAGSTSDTRGNLFSLLPPSLHPVSPFRPLSQTALPFSREGEPRKFVAHDVSARRNENATAKLPISSPQIFLAAPASFRSPPPPLVFPTVWKDREDPIDSSFSPVCSLFSSHNEEKLEGARSPDIIEL